MGLIDYLKLGKGNPEKYYQIMRESCNDYHPIVDRIIGKDGGDLLLQEVPLDTIEYARVQKDIKRGVLIQKDNGRRRTFDDILKFLDNQTEFHI